QSSTSAEGVLTLTLAGRLDAHTLTSVWPECRQAIVRQAPKRVVVEATQVTYCDGAGIAMLIDLRRQQDPNNKDLEVRGLAQDYQRLLELFEASALKEEPRTKPECRHLPEEVGRAAAELGRDVRKLVDFIGDLTAALVGALRHPKRVRWRDALMTAE